MPIQTVTRGKRAILRQYLQRAVVVALLVLGVKLVISVILFAEAHPRMVYIMLGFLLIELGAVVAINKLPPYERRYLALRSETDYFLNLLYDLNAAAIKMHRTNAPYDCLEFDRIQEAMLESVERMSIVAGKTDAQLAAESHDHFVHMM